MFFAKFCRFLTACLLILLASGCVTSISPVDVERNEAMKARVNLALAYLEQGDFSKARENIDKALSHDSQDYLPHSVEAYYFQQLSDTENASKSYQKAIELSQKQSMARQPLPDVLNNYGTFLCEQGKFSQAYLQFEQALKSQQGYYQQADTLENIVLCAIRENNLSKKQQALSTLIILAPERATKFVK